MNFIPKIILFVLSIALAFISVACVETPPPNDTNLPASGPPKSWEGGMPGMSGMMPDDR